MAIYYVHGRRTGKTTKILDWLMEDPDGRIIACPNNERRQYLLREIKRRWDVEIAARMERSIVNFGYSDTALRGRHVREVGIDDVDEILASYFAPNKVTFITATGTAL